MLFVQTGFSPEKDAKQKGEQELEERPIRYLCASCRKHISDASHLMTIQGDTPYHFFANPEGVLFEIVTLSWCHNLRDGSPAVRQDTWFPGYAWTVQYCSGCQVHMGWRYDGGDREPATFYGIVRDRLIEEEDASE
jgi:hypothetical protein